MLQNVLRGLLAFIVLLMIFAKLGGVAIFELLLIIALVVGGLEISNRRRTAKSLPTYRTIGRRGTCEDVINRG